MYAAPVSCLWGAHDDVTDNTCRFPRHPQPVARFKITSTNNLNSLLVTEARSFVHQMIEEIRGIDDFPAIINISDCPDVGGPPSDGATQSGKTGSHCDTITNSAVVRPLRWITSVMALSGGR